MINNPLENTTDFLAGCPDDVAALYAACNGNNPNYGVGRDEFESALRGAVDKYLVDASTGTFPSTEAVRAFLSELQVEDLYLAIGCAHGNEHAWWDFDAGYRRYIERVAHHLSSAENDAEEVIDHVYVELYGTRVVEGVRQSKFASYSGRGSLRGWLRTIVWHAVVDMHRARKDEVPIDDWTESGGELSDRPGFRAEERSEESEVLDRISREKYARYSLAALSRVFGSLEDHEKLLLLYYHADNLKLREIARLVEQPESPLRRWFQRQSRKRVATPDSRVHESTVMRWLERTYSAILSDFRDFLRQHMGLGEHEIEICVEIAASDLGEEGVRKHLMNFSAQEIGKHQGE